MLLEIQEDLSDRLRDLQARLDEAEETLRALRSGEVDAIVASGPGGDQVYTLKGADETYRVMVQEMAEGALTLTLDGLILFSNKQFASMLDSPLERVIGSRLLDFVAPEDASIVVELLRGTDGSKAEVRLNPHRAQQLKPVYLSARAVVLDGSRCYCVIVTDLSAQKRYDEIVAVMEAVPVGVFIAHDTECRRVVGNHAAYELLRLPASAEISSPMAARELPRSWREVRNGQDIPAGDLPMQVAARTGKPVHDCEFDVAFDDGTSRSWLGNAVPLFNEARQTRGAVGVFVDITERKRAAEALDATNVELRNVVHALTHELQEPLSAVLRFNRQLAMGPVAKLGSRSIAGALRIEAILQGLLRYWEITERIGEKLLAVDCGEVLLRTLSNLRAAIQQHGAVVTFDSLPTLVADEVMLASVFQELIDNAIRFGGDATPRIHISAAGGGGRWLFSVRDKGVGIAPADARRVFDMFNHAGSGGIAGTGIGLALCKKVIERHGGRIWVESEEGVGAAFRFTIPNYLSSALPGFVSRA
jgi:signal transduction histidine kinase